MTANVDRNSKYQWIFTAVLLIFAISFTIFKIQSDDLLMYLAMARDFIVPGRWPTTDPYLYSLPQAALQMSHEYLSYLVFFGVWNLGEWPGLILFKGLILSIMFATVLRAKPFDQNRSLLFIWAWTLAVIAASFRFIERSSMFSDLFCVLLIAWLCNQRSITRGLVARLTVLFLVWVQLHPGFPLGIAVIAMWAAWHWFRTPGFRSEPIQWLLLPLLAVCLNPTGISGALYPFQFAFNEAKVLRQINLEWFPAYHPLFRFSPEVLAFWTLALISIYAIVRHRLWHTWAGWTTLFCLILATQTVRFVPWTAFAVLILLKPWLRFDLNSRVVRVLTVLMLVCLSFLSIKNLSTGYSSSSGYRSPGFELDPTHFPIKTFEVLRTQPQTGRLYNSQSFGSYLVWMKATPIFHHGFVTDMQFYQNDVMGALNGPESFVSLAKKYNWTMLLVDKNSSYRYFYNVLSPRTQWKIVAEDEGSYLIYLQSGSEP